MARRRVGARLLLLAQLTQALRATRRSLAGAAGAVATAPQVANAVRPPEFVTQQPGFTPTKSGLQIKDVKEGTARRRPRATASSTSGRPHIGYFGRPFEKKAGLKGGDFEGERDYRASWWAGATNQIPRGTLPESCDLHAIDATPDRRRRGADLLTARLGQHGA